MTESHVDSNRIEDLVRIPVQSPSNKAAASTILEGNLTIPHNFSTTKGIIVFAHDYGSSRHSSTNSCVAQVLNKDGLATLLVDLTKEEEEADVRTEKVQCKIPGLILNKFNIKLLSDRLLRITNWLLTVPYFETQRVIVGYFGTSTGAAAALTAAAQKDTVVGAVVCCSGRPDLVSDEVLTNIQVPSLFIVGARDNKKVIDINNNAINKLRNVQKKKVAVVPEATHLYEEPAALENVARLASGWFRCYFLIKQHNNDY
jgi:putative phosphoribosyl transferase